MKWIQCFSIASMCMFASCQGGDGIAVSDEDRLFAEQTGRDVYNRYNDGIDDFGTSMMELEEAMMRDPGNQGIRYLYGITCWFDAMRRLFLPAGPANTGLDAGVGRNLAFDLGWVNANEQSGNFFDIHFIADPNRAGEGDFVDSTPALSVPQSFLITYIVPINSQLITDLTGVGTFADTYPTSPGLFTPAQRDIEIDIGDLYCTRAWANAMNASIYMGGAYDVSQVIPNDYDLTQFSMRDPLDFFFNNAQNAGDLIDTSMLLNARTYVQRAADDWQLFDSYTRTEGASRFNSGLFTATQDYAEFLDLSSQLTLGLQLYTNSMYNQNATLAIPNTPFTIRPAIPFTPGINKGQLYNNSVTDVRTDLQVLAVPTDPDAFSIGGFIVQPLLTDGDFFTDWYLDSHGELRKGPGAVLRIDNPIVSSKTMDGGFSDWAPGTYDFISDTPRWKVDPEFSGMGPDLGQIRTSVSDDILYLYLNRDITSIFNGSQDQFRVQVEFDGGWGRVDYSGSAQQWFTASNGMTTPTFADAPGQGIEMMFQLPGVDYAGLTVEANADNPTYRFTNHRQFFAQYAYTFAD